MTDTPDISDTQDVNFTIRDGWGLIELDRPAALNALTVEMCEAIDHVLRDWATHDDVEGVLVHTLHEKAFCAGGDIRTLYEESKRDPASAAEFFRAEYTMNALIHDYEKPYVALVDGICMGGGVGLSIGASHLVMSEKAVWAMPETGIGLFPDVGGSHFLPRLPGGLGPYLALTGHRLNGADCLYANIADHFVSSDKFSDVFDALMELDTIDDTSVGEAISAFEQAEQGSLAETRPEIDQYFETIESLGTLMTHLKEEGGGFANHTLERLQAMSPTSMKIALEQMRRGRSMSFGQVMQMEFAIASRVMEGPDFQEGVRALMVDKDKSPKWNPATPEAISEEAIQRYFEPLPPERSLKL